MSCNVFYPGEESMLLGVALCGGHSTRMGSDKGLLESEGKKWSQIACEKLAKLQIPVVISIREAQKQAYSEHFFAEDLVTDLGDIKGPLAGLMAVHSRFTENDLLVLACDLPDLSSEVLDKLSDLYQEKAGEHDFLVFQNEGEYEPLVGIYTAEGLSKIASLLSSGQLEKHSMKYILEIGNTYSYLIPAAWKPFFKNYNEKEEVY